MKHFSRIKHKCGLYIAKVLVAINFPNISKIKLEDYEFPDWTHIFGEIITVSILVGQAITFVWIIVDQIFFKKKTFLSLFKPDFENYHPLKTRNHLKVSIARGLVSQDSLPSSDFKTNSVSFKTLESKLKCVLFFVSF